MLGFDSIGQDALAEFPTTATTTTLTAAQGSFSLTGEASLFKITELTVQGSFALMGEAAALTPAVVAARASFALTGEPALFQIDAVLAHGSIALTGESSILTPELAASYGSFTLTGIDAALVSEPYAITDTEALQLPINCILAGQQLVRDRYRENNLFAPNLREGRKIQGVSVQLDKFGKFKKPGFTVTTNKKGYD